MTRDDSRPAGYQMLICVLILAACVGVAFMIGGPSS